MNMGFEEEELKPYIEPVQDWQDQKRIDILQVSTYSQWCTRKRGAVGERMNSPTLREIVKSL